MYRIIFFLFLISSIVYAKDPPKQFLDDEYIFKFEENIKYPYDTGFWGPIETHTRIHQNAWALRYDNKITKTNEYSLRFEKRLDDCGAEDCNRKEKTFIGRSELGFFDPITGEKIRGHLGEFWYTWSFYIDPASGGPKNMRDFVHIGQFKMDLEHEKLTRSLLTSQTIDEFNVACPEMSFFFSWRYDGIYVGRSGVSVCDGSDYKRIIPLNNVKGKWHTVLLNINWTDQEDGKIKLWLNDQLIYRFEGKTISKIVKNKNEYQMGPKFRFGLYSQGENGDQVMHYEGMKAEKSCNKLQLFDCNYIQKQEIDVVKTNPADPDDGNQIVGQYETNDDQGKRDRIINTLINKITKDISKKSNSNKDDIKTWVATEVNKLDWDKDLDKSKDRKKIRDQLTKKGKKTFK